MISPKFYLKNNQSEKPTPIMLTFKHNKKLFRLSTERLIQPELWDKETQRPTKKSSLLKEWKKFDSIIKVNLQNIETHLNQLHRDCVNEFEALKRENKSVDLDLLKERLKTLYLTTAIRVDSKDSFNGYIDRFVFEITEGTRLIQSGRNRGKKYEDGTIKTYKEWKTQWNKFQKYEGRKFDWLDLDDSLCEKFIQFFVSKDNSMNTIGKHIKNLKSIIGYGFKDKMHSNLDYKNFPVYKTDITRVVLKEDELQLLMNEDFDNEEMRVDVDIFLIGCYSALRFSDYSRIEPKYISLEDSAKYIKMISTKGKQNLVVPIGRKLDSILVKYNYHPPKTNAQRLNKNIKEACKLLNIDTLIEVNKIKGGKDIIEHIPKYKLVQSHTARRTAATNLFLNKMSTLLIMNITGHKKESSFMKYIVINDNESAKLVMENPYLN